jgi:processive 1,2-diacylglycerol beta-glucosyltransferase
MPPRVLITWASSGTGHMHAARAVELALRRRAPDAEITNVDLLDLASGPYRRLYRRAYAGLISAAPHLVGILYDALERPDRTVSDRPTDRLRLGLQRLNLRKFIHLLRSERWDLVVNAHVLPAEVAAALRREGRFDAPQVLVHTDFESHRLMVQEPCERYFTATAESALYLQGWGVPAAATCVTGIPIHPAFAEAKDPAECRRRQGPSGERPVVLQLAGGFGVGPIQTILEQMLAVPRPLEVVVLAGRNERARRQLAAVPVPDRHRVRLPGYTDQMDELMAAADLVVSRCGGVTSAEALARGVPQVAVKPNPGWEARNCDYLLENGAAVKVNNPRTLAAKVTALLDQPDQLERMRANARRLGRPRAAFDVVDESLRLIRSPT